MKRPSVWLSVAVVVSALAPAALTGSMIWAGDGWASALKTGPKVSFTISDGKIKYYFKGAAPAGSRYRQDMSILMASSKGRNDVPNVVTESNSAP